MLKILYLLIILLSSFNCQGNYHQIVSDKDYASIPVLFHLDDYDRCMLIEDALFCTFTFQLKPLYPENERSTWNIIKNITSDPRNYRHDRLRHGICVATTCPNATQAFKGATISKHIETCYSQKYQHLGLRGNITKISCQTNETKYPIDLYDIIVAGLFIFYMGFVIFASVYEGSARYQKKDVYEKITSTMCGKIITAFSIPKNWYRLTSINNNPDALKLRSIQGVRFYNMICVILCHTLMISFAGPVANTKYIENITKEPLNMFIANGNYVVQTFFLISGWLLSFHFFQMLEGGKDMNLKYLILAFINRYIRLTPTLAIMIAFESTWLVHMGQGPQWDVFVAKEYRSCRKNWWTNLLYINNYVNKKEMCLHQSWYVAADTQLFILSLLILMVTWKNLDKIKVIFGSVIVIGMIIPGTIAFIYDYDIIIRQYPEVLYDLNGLQRDDWHDLYSSGYSNITGYMIGMTCGYLFYNYRNKVLATKMIHTILWWILSFGLCIFIILIAANMYDPGYEHNRLESAMYWAFGKNVFAFGIAVGIFGMTQKIGWFARWFCEWQGVQVFGRLTYSTYIIHTVLIRIRSGFLRYPVFINDYLMLTTALGDIVLSFLGGTLLGLFVEMPISALQKLMVPQLATKRQIVSSEKSLKNVNYEDCGSEIDKETVYTKV